MNLEIISTCFTVPALHKDPDIQIFDHNQTHTLIEYERLYYGKWNTEDMNQDTYYEGGKIRFSIQAWVFQTHPITRIARWQSFSESRYLRRRFQVTQSNISSGLFSFLQSSRLSRVTKFHINIITLTKLTKNMEIIYTSLLLSFIPVGRGLVGRAAIVEFCVKWKLTTDEIIENNSITCCPVNLESAKIHPYFVEDFTCSVTVPDCNENIKAHQCYLKKSINNT